MEAIVEEELTGRKQNTTIEISLHKSKYKIELRAPSKKYKPGLPFTVLVSEMNFNFQSQLSKRFASSLQASVQRFDGTPVTGDSNEIRIQQKASYYTDVNTTETTHSLDKNGLLHYSVTVPHSNGFTLKFFYMDAVEQLDWISAVQSDVGVYVKATIKTEK